MPGALVLLAGNLIQTTRVDVPWLVWLGLMPRAFASVDYFPLLTWFGVVLPGLALGATGYGATGRRFPTPPGGASPPARLLGFLGRYSLLIYLIPSADPDRAPHPDRGHESSSLYDNRERLACDPLGCYAGRRLALA